MKKILLLFIIVNQVSFGQNDIILRINHFMGDEQFSSNVLGINNINQNFTFSRIEYYISEIYIKHDGNQITTIDNTWLLVNALNETIVNLGSYPIDSVESLWFHIGVDSNHNHLDPSLYPVDHVLAPKSPFMHWGWVGGYSFFVFEGNGEGNDFELHVAGDANYSSVSSFYSKTGTNNNELNIQLNADYKDLLKNLDVNDLIVHDDETNPKIGMAVSNFKKTVFSAYEGDFIVREEVPNSILEVTESSISIHPNPSYSNFSITGCSFNQLYIYNSIGKKIKTFDSSTKNIYLDKKGIYFVHFVKEGELTIIKKIIVH